MAKKENTMNTREFISHLRHRNKRGQKAAARDVTANLPAPSGVDIFTIAVVLDGVVQEVIRAQDRMAALFLSNPSFVEIVESDFPKSKDGHEFPTIGWKVEGFTFTPPENAPVSHEGQEHIHE